MIQDIAPHIYNNQYKSIIPTTGNTIIVVKDRMILAKYDHNQLVYPTYLEGYEYEYLFTIDELPYFFVVSDTESFEAYYLEQGYEYYPMRKILISEPRYLAFAGLTASQMIRFYTTRRFCGKCGHPMIRSKEERRMDCPNCHTMEYPKISPCVIVGVVYQDSILLTQYNGGKMYALIAGFNETGETIEETVRREVLEEAGLEVDHLHYYKSQPWSLSDTLLFGFYCEAKDNTITVDHSELATAFFSKQEDLPDYLDRGSLTAEMIMNFKEKGRKVLNHE